MPTAKSAAPAPLTAIEELAALTERVERLEAAYEGMLSGKVAEISQEERDRITLSRRPNSYPEAVEFEAAQERQAARNKERAGKDEAPAEQGQG